MSLNTISRATLAYASYPFIGARNAGQKFGRIPYVSVPVKDYTVATFEPPVPFAPARPAGFPENAKWDADPPYPVTQHQIANIPGGLADHGGYVFTSDGRPVHGACHPRKQMLKYRWKTRRDGVAADYMRETGDPVHIPGDVAVVTATNHDCYYHWIFDILPRMVKALEHAPDVDRIYLQRKSRFQDLTLDLLGIDPSRIVNTEDVPWISADNLIVPCHQIMTGHHHPRWVTDWIRSAFLPHAEREGEGRRIYVSRSIARNRRVKNEDEIYGMLKARGFEFVHAEKLSFQQQIGMFAEAEAVVAPHGAGLTNLAFCAPGTKVIELFPSLVMDCYHRLCVDLDLHYAFVKTRQFRLHRRVGEDFSVDPDDFKQALALHDL